MEPSKSWAAAGNMPALASNGMARPWKDYKFPFEVVSSVRFCHVASVF